MGESSRSAYERGWEHINDMAQLKSSSHMLKHTVGVHQNEDMEKVHFGMRVHKFTTSSFERQIRESVVIQTQRKGRKFPASWFLPRFAVVNPLPVLPLSIFGFRGTISQKVCLIAC